MKVIRNSVVALKYEVLDGRGEVVERGHEPMVYLHGGHGGIFPKVEEALADKAAGEKVRVRLAPEDAFGPRDPGLVRVEPRSRFRGKVKLGIDRKSTRLNSSHMPVSRMPSSA